MDAKKISEYSTLATQAILETLGQSKLADGAVARALEHINDDMFNEILKGTALGMQLQFVKMNPDYGILLRSKNLRGPFAPTLGWLNKRLGIDAAAATDRIDARKVEMRMLSGLMLVAVLSDLFPTADSVRLEWDSSMPIDANSVVQKLNSIADDVLKFQGEDTSSAYTNMALVIKEERIPKVSRELSNNVSATRSQHEMAQRWIKLLQEHGLLIEDKGLAGDTQWMATRRLKAYIKDAGILPLVDSVLSMRADINVAQTDRGVE